MSKKQRNIVWHPNRVPKAEREKRNKHRGAVVWFTGLPSSGKSTIAVELEKVLFDTGVHAYILDGDNVRHRLNEDLDFSPEAREENIRRIGEVGWLFADSGTIALSAFVSPYRKDRDLARSLLEKGDFVEVFVKADVETCRQRDPKGLYKKALAGEIPDFTGISAPYEEPPNPEVVVDTTKLSVEQSAQAVLDYLKSAGIVSP